MRAIDFLFELHEHCHFQTREGKRVGEASRSELRRWFQNRAVEINGKRLEAMDEISFPIVSMILFPSGRRVTLR